MTLILPQMEKTYDWFRLVEGVDAYLRLLRKNGVPDSALSPVLVGVDDVNVWVGEVLNGGHSQYVGNKGDAAVPNLRRALVAVLACGMQGWAAILRNVIDWVRDTPDQAARMTGFTGGISDELQALDRTFAATWKRDEAAFVAAFMGLPGVRLVAKDAFEDAVRAEAQRCLTTSPDLRRGIAREVAETCRAWFEDADKVAFALACGKVGFTSRVVMGPLPADDVGRASYGMFPVPAGRPEKFGIAFRSPAGLRFQTGIPPETGKVLAEVTKAEIDRAQKMALAFRLPESIGLRWARTGRSFSISAPILRVMPGVFWRPSKWRILLECKDWAVKGSPKLTSFADGVGQWQERLTQAELSVKITDAGLTPKWATPI